MDIAPVGPVKLDSSDFPSDFAFVHESNNDSVLPVVSFLLSRDPGHALMASPILQVPNLDSDSARAVHPREGILIFNHNRGSPTIGIAITTYRKFGYLCLQAGLCLVADIVLMCCFIPTDPTAA
jgi:hypothetical protein